MEMNAMEWLLGTRGMSIINLNTLALRRSEEIAHASPETIYRILRSMSTNEIDGLVDPRPYFVDLDRTCGSVI